MTISHRPIKPSQDEVRRWEPEELAAIDERGAVCKWRVARL